MEYHRLFWLLFASSFMINSIAQHENIPYQDVANICETCVCVTSIDSNKHTHHRLSCAMKNFNHILAHWPKEFGANHNGVDIVATFSGNSIELLQQLPTTNASLSFACRNCGIKKLQVPTFMDVPNIKRLDLSFNALTLDELTPDVFRGPYRTTHYEPIALTDLDLSHNQLHSLNRKLFEHTPDLIKLNLSHNELTVLDSHTNMALATVVNLETLDLSYTGIKWISASVFQALTKLKTLNLAGNLFTSLPESISLIGRTLQILNMASNEIEKFEDQSFAGLKALRRLNISDMRPLKFISNKSFDNLETLEYLYCSHNQKLEEFDLNGLMHSTNLTHLDISHCSIGTLSLAFNLTEVTADKNNSNSSFPRPWLKLRYFETVGNPWVCDCTLFETLEFIGDHHQRKDTETRCDSPYLLAGARFSNLTAVKICSMQLPTKYLVIEEDPPRFLRKRYIILTLITAAVVIVIGLMIGFMVSCIRRRLKSDDFGTEPIRYTSVRCSTLSAFSHIPPPSTSNA